MLHISCIIVDAYYLSHTIYMSTGYDYVFVRKLVVYNDSSPCIRYYVTNYLVIIILYIYIYLSVSESLIDSQQSRSN